MAFTTTASRMAQMGINFGLATGKSIKHIANGVIYCASSMAILQDRVVNPMFRRGRVACPYTERSRSEKMGAVSGI